MDLTTVSHATVLASFERLATLAPSGSCTHLPGVQATATGVDHPSFNSAMVKTGAVAPSSLTRALEVLNESGFPYSSLAPCDLSDRAHAVLSDYGLVDYETIPVMTAVRPSGVPWPRELERVEGPDAFAAHRQLVQDVFGLQQSLVESFLPDEVLWDPGTRVVVGLADGEPVVTALSLSNGPIAGVFDVATKPEFRGRGYGAAASAAVTDPCFADGTRSVTLQSSTIGLSVYESLGFRTMLHHHRWSPRQAVL